MTEETLQRRQSKADPATSYKTRPSNRSLPFHRNLRSLTFDPPQLSVFADDLVLNFFFKQLLTSVV